MLVLVRRVSLAILVLLGAAGTAQADLTVFAGLQNQPSIRPATGISLGVGLLVVGWEVEVARVTEESDELAPSLATGTGSVYVQNPIPISGVQFYGIAGAGVYRERLQRLPEAHQETNVHLALGGGAKIALAGPLKLRLDYRIFKLRNALATNPQRIYAGLALSF
jgi:opacity protein-like surface antigen